MVSKMIRIITMMVMMIMMMKTMPECRRIIFHVAGYSGDDTKAVNHFIRSGELLHCFCDHYRNR